MSDQRQTCDFCGTEFDWTDEQKLLDLQLRLMGSGLGSMCDSCGDKMIELAIAEEEQEEERLAEERREWENAEMDRHFREHPHG